MISWQLAPLFTWMSKTYTSNTTTKSLIDLQPVVSLRTPLCSNIIIDNQWQKSNNTLDRLFLSFTHLQISLLSRTRTVESPAGSPASTTPRYSNKAGYSELSFDTWVQRLLRTDSQTLRYRETIRLFTGENPQCAVREPKQIQVYPPPLSCLSQGAVTYWNRVQPLTKIHRHMLYILYFCLNECLLVTGNVAVCFSVCVCVLVGLVIELQWEPWQSVYTGVSENWAGALKYTSCGCKHIQGFLWTDIFSQESLLIQRLVSPSPQRTKWIWPNNIIHW